MPDLLSHALIAYTLCTALSWRLDWLSPAYVTVGMAGAFIPDIRKIQILVPPERVEALLGIPFDWVAVHRFGGAAVAMLVGVVLAAEGERRRVAGLLSLGAGSHLLADSLLRNASGRSFPLLWPLTEYVPPTPGLYHSTDVWPAVVLGAIAAAVWWLRYRR
jgi:hypothetical protein